MTANRSKLQSSFRDPSGFVFTQNGTLFRQVNFFYKENYDLLMSCGLYQKLIRENLLIPHQESQNLSKDPAAYKIIQPEPIPFVSYPYEWCFGQLKEAALLTLQVQKTALNFGLSLKDASSFNVQFIGFRPVFIDTLSFEKFEEGKAWTAYRQFCEQFLAPLTLMAERDISLGKLLGPYLGSIPLDLANNLLPLTSKLHPSSLIHLVLHAKSQQKYANTFITRKVEIGKFKKQSMAALVDNLEGAILRLSWQPRKTVWASYYDPPDRPSYSPRSLAQKEKLVAKFISRLQPKLVWDLGANTGLFSQIAAKKKAYIISMDNDPSVVELNYRQIKKNQGTNILPLWIDITNPTPLFGWENSERDSLFTRPKPDLILALALIHHLAIANNLPLGNLAQFFARHCQALIIEFVPKTDPQAKRLLAHRRDIFPGYNQENFEKEFTRFFAIEEKVPLKSSLRVLYLLTKKEKTRTLPYPTG